MVRTKLPDHAIEAFRHVLTAVPGATLDVVGDGYMREHLERRRPPGVTFHGFISETRKQALLDRTDLLLMPGTREGWGITVMEAGAHGVPAVAYDVPGLRDAVVDGESGVLTRPAPAAMAAAVVSLLNDLPRAARLSVGASARARHFTWDRAAASLLAVIEARVPDRIPSGVGSQS
jgi:glycosyltransferase involved in cell wall biosynthesis